jgi:hypothetical protein
MFTSLRTTDTLSLTDEELITWPDAPQPRPPRRSRPRSPRRSRRSWSRTGTSRRSRTTTPRTSRPPRRRSDDELDEVEDDEEEPAKKAGPKRAPIQYGSAWAAEQVNELAGTQHSAYTLRALIRQMVKAGAFDRAVGEDRSRYEFTGPNDKKLAAIVKFAKKKAAEPKASRTDALEKARAARAANLAAAKAAKEEDSDEEETPAPKRRKTKAKAAKPAPEPVDADEEFEDLDDE